ncbi:MAG: putative nicotinate phosphoribosyltransferase [Methanoregulaceae archaeon PtaU1.Bin059]|nr:MAG: putative nicotinate phosphoribosyltransferase [Methanoregulaceae archaeon PtaB.Bin152]OPY40596.1 MAG: putative nicotinate phosphoribosyltransferase [Methanoregulaceae archaeon PtaU1.Bin059]
MGRFGIVDDERIRRGECTDVYFMRSEAVLSASGRNPRVAMEVTASMVPGGAGILCGMEDAISLLEDLPLDASAMPEGSLFYPWEPVLRVEGKYRDIARYETAILGFLCHASGIATAAARIKAVACDREIFSFGSRRQHPAIATMVERSAWIGGVDGVSNTCAPDGLPLAGTMPHAFVMCYPSPDEAFMEFDRHSPPGVPRIMLCDTFCDEKRESLTGARCGAEAVRLDTPRSRRGDMRAILEEVRWELDAAGYPGVRIFLSGGVTLDDVARYRDIVGAFGVGGAIANAPVIDFAMDMVEKEGKKCAKRGKRSGAKQVWEFPGGRHVTLPVEVAGPPGAEPLLQPRIRGGSVLSRSTAEEARQRVLARIPILRDRGQGGQRGRA